MFCVNLTEQKAVYRWILEPADRDAVLANVVIKSGKNYNVIVEIATISSPEELLAVRRAYLNRYKHSLEEDLAAHTTGHTRQASSSALNTCLIHSVLKKQGSFDRFLKRSLFVQCLQSDHI